MTGFYPTILKCPELGPDIYLTEQVAYVGWSELSDLTIPSEPKPNKEGIGNSIDTGVYILAGADIKRRLQSMYDKLMKVASSKIAAAQRQRVGSVISTSL